MEQVMKMAIEAYCEISGYSFEYVANQCATNFEGPSMPDSNHDGSCIKITTEKQNERYLNWKKSNQKPRV